MPLYFAFVDDSGVGFEFIWNRGDLTYFKKGSEDPYKLETKYTRIQIGRI